MLEEIAIPLLMIGTGLFGLGYWFGRGNRDKEVPKIIDWTINQLVANGYIKMKKETLFGMQMERMVRWNEMPEKKQKLNNLDK